MIIKEPITIPSISGKLERSLYIYLPPEYDMCEDRYPVLYMFDGHNVFYDEDATYGKSWGMARYLEEANPAVIIVGVECNPRGTRRLCEYSPWKFEDAAFGSIKGIGKRYMRWLVNELKPSIDENFRTLPDREHTAICGSSMGGLMTVYAVTAHNDVFSMGAALSPSLWDRPDLTWGLINRTEFDPNTMLYMDYGSSELDNHPDMANIMERTFAKLLRKSVCATLRIIPGGEHCEASWEQQLPIVMECLDFKRRGNAEAQQASFGEEFDA